MDRFSQMSGTNSAYLEEMFDKFQSDPNSVSLEWRTFFESVDTGYNMVVQKKGAVPALTGKASDAQSQASHLIQSYRTLGHKYAKTNPLDVNRESEDDIDLSSFGLSESDLGRTFSTDGLLKQPQATLKEIVSALKQTYTSSIGVEFATINDREERLWLQDKMESVQNKPELSKDVKKRFLQGLMSSEKFENFLHTKYVGVKRFSGEGCDVLVPMLDVMIDTAGEMGAEDVVMGMAHRGRLTTLVNIFEKPLEQVFAGFNDSLVMDDDLSSGDVKYHMGKSYDITTYNGHKLHMSLLNNPSHLEAVNPVVEGSSRAKQHLKGENGETKVLPVLIHGDSAFCGQGIVPETLNLAGLEGYRTGGTIHLVINNQVGFTANPDDVFSGEYCTDVARILQTPIFHVNGDDAEACAHVMKLATEWRMKFGKDVVIDVVCYRKYGHNEGDDPSFTQPVMYGKIKGHPSVYTQYKEQVISEKSLTSSEIESMEEDYQGKLSQAFEAVKEKETKIVPDMFKGAWEGYGRVAGDDPKTAISKKLLEKISNSFVTWPKDFTPHPKVGKAMEKRKEMLTEGGMDWGAAEVAAYASLLSDGYGVRLSGQDVRRGTFSHRHIALWDHKTGEPYMPVSMFETNTSNLEVWNSSLSELAVLGFEFGYSLAAPNTLTIWEAQFGDFSNGAQIVMDQFVSSSEVKWQRMSGLVMLLPHGFEGQGPEHSSARPERYLQLCAQNNMTVCNVTTPAQIFHLLRKQMLKRTRRPLIVFTPKSLLRHPKAISSPDDLTSGSFEKVIPDSFVKASSVKKVAFCTGKIYYDLQAKQEADKRADVALVRVEQLYPHPIDELKKILKTYSKAKNFVWVQEEPRNSGAWTFVQDTLAPELGITLDYIGRSGSASPAVGAMSRHKAEQNKIVETVFAK